MPALLAKISGSFLPSVLFFTKGSCERVPIFELTNDNTYDVAPDMYVWMGCHWRRLAAARMKPFSPQSLLDRLKVGFIVFTTR